MSSQAELKDKFIGTFIGLSLGDALGAPYEGGLADNKITPYHPSLS